MDVAPLLYLFLNGISPVLQSRAAGAEKSAPESRLWGVAGAWLAGGRRRGAREEEETGWETEGRLQGSVWSSWTLLRPDAEKGPLRPRVLRVSYKDRRKQLARAPGPPETGSRLHCYSFRLRVRCLGAQMESGVPASQPVLLPSGRSSGPATSWGLREHLVQGQSH